MIYKFLKEHAKKQPISFHMPGHKGAALYHKYGYGDFFTDLADLDITEIPGADNLFQAEDIIQSVQEAYRELYQVKASYLLINGTSGGLIAAILATVPRGKKLIMARNCHKSVFNALTLGGIEPVYAYPEEGPVAGPISPQEIEALLKANPDGEAVILPSPNYYGICSDIEAIAKIVHQAGKVLIVDQAHGAHLKFFHRYVKDSVGKLPLAAEDAGADIVVNSIHKTLASFTQSAVLNLTSTRVNPYVLEDKLQAIQSTSPSYLLMASLDINAQLLKDHGGTLMGEWWDLLNHFYAQAKKIPELTVMAEDGMDVTKLNLTLSGYSGLELEKKLMEENIFTELSTGDILMAMTGIGNKKEDVDKLLITLQALGKGSKERNKRNHCKINEKPTPKAGRLHPVPQEKEYVDIDKSIGRISGGSIIPYPPGIPFICPGEELSTEAVEYIKALRAAGEKVIGINEKGEISVGK